MMNRTMKLGIYLGIVGILFSCNLSAQKQDNKGERKGPPSFSELLEKMDENEDGKISKDEAKGPLEKHFDKIDLNEDGLLTEEEFEKAPKPKRGPKKR
ncbi:MAG: EF-hand domain-containing protein [Allomuricauda sp.]